MMYPSATASGSVGHGVFAVKLHGKFDFGAEQ
jgi:hypothetical protein